MAKPKRSFCFLHPFRPVAKPMGSALFSSFPPCVQADWFYTFFTFLPYFLLAPDTVTTRRRASVTVKMRTRENVLTVCSIATQFGTYTAGGANRKPWALWSSSGPAVP